MRHSIFGRWARLGVAAGLTLGLGLGFGSASIARPASDSAKAEDNSRAAYEEVASFPMLTRPHSWTALDDDTVIVWTTPFQAYLVELAFPSYDLRYALVIGVTSVGSRVYARFDALNVAGIRYPIDSIYKMSREEARNLTKKS